MSDTRLRELERRWRETGAVEDEAALLRERVRAGVLSADRLRLAAYAGHAAAIEAVGPLALPEDAVEWVCGLEAWNVGLTVWALSVAYHADALDTPDREEEARPQLVEFMERARDAFGADRFVELREWADQLDFASGHAKWLRFATDAASGDPRYVALDDPEIVRAREHVDRASGSPSFWSYSHTRRRRRGSWSHMFAFRRNDGSCRWREVDVSPGWNPADVRSRPPERISPLREWIIFTDPARALDAAHRAVREWALGPE